MKKLIALLLLGIGSTAFADMPYISNNTSENFERVTSGDITCESRKAVATLNTGYYSSSQDSIYTSKTGEDKGVFVAVSIPLSSTSKQVDCKNLYNSALEKEQLRVKQLEMQVEMLKSRRLTTD